MSEWLDLMLDEIQRKRREQEAAAEEQAKRTGEEDAPDVEAPGDNQSK